MTANNKRPIKANELVLLLSGLMDLDVEMMARVGNVPVRNLRTWLAGKKDNLRPQSVINLMSLLGLKVGKGIRLDDNRVHYWTIFDGMFTRKKLAYQPLSALSKLFIGCQITAVRPLKPSLTDRLLRAHYLVSGPGVRLVICVRKGAFARSNVSPEIIKGATWRDDNEHHTIPTSARLWHLLVDRDLTSFEFDEIFLQTEERVSWGDVSLMARECGVTAADAADWIAKTYGDANQGDVPDDAAGFDLDGGVGKLVLLVGNNQNRRAA